MKPGVLRIGIAAVLVLGVGGGMGWMQWRAARDMTVSGDPAASLAAQVGGPWTLSDPQGRTVTNETWRGKVQVMFFGYRFCPDICPTELQTIGQAMDLLGADAAGVQPLFVSIDPARDRGSVLAEYTAQFHPSIIGLSGTAAQTAAIARAYRVYYAKVVPAGADPDDYSMDHSSIVYLIGRDGKTAGLLPAGTAPDAMAAAIRHVLAGGPAT
ncbi:MAG: SCO family protein [Azospirillaceae bacterium]|nr:SCO family protein [Azospirillaceae bacterium]